MKLAALISGGKDSLYATYLESKNNEIACLISIKSKNKESYMFHIPNIELAKIQAEAMKIPLLFIESSGIKEEELGDIKNVLIATKKEYEIEGVVTGALYSDYQKNRIDKICKELELKSIAPLWHIDLEKYLKELVKSGFEVIITGIAADGFDKSWLGKKIDLNLIDKLKLLSKKNKINIGGEGGEYESFVIDCPMFRKKIEILDAEIKMENENTGHYIIKRATLK